jgi:hypothetical protein
MGKQQDHKSGQICPTSGQYQIVGKRGGRTGKERTVVEGKRFPPTLEPGQGFRLVDPTKH